MGFLSIFIVFCVGVLVGFSSVAPKNPDVGLVILIAYWGCLAVLAVSAAMAVRQHNLETESAGREQKMETDEEAEISADMARDKAVETLAARLYWCWEMFDPPCTDFVPWEELPLYDRALYDRLIRDIISSNWGAEIRAILDREWRIPPTSDGTDV